MLPYLIYKIVKNPLYFFELIRTLYITQHRNIFSVFVSVIDDIISELLSLF